MGATTTTAKRKVGLTTILSVLFIIITIVWGTYTVLTIQLGQVRELEPHVPLDEVQPWNYNINWAGGRSNWFDNVNYTDLPLDQQLPQDLLDQLNNTLFVVEPANPAQLWRSTAYDAYDGHSWSKTIPGSETPLSTIAPGTYSNQVYTISMNLTVSASTQPIELPSLFPRALVIQDSFRSIPAGALIDYDLKTDAYGTVLFYPFLSGNLGDTVIIQYNVTYTTQDLQYVQANARNGSIANPSIAQNYATLDGVQLSQSVLDAIDPFRTVGTNAYDKAMAVDVYFKTHYQLLTNPPEVYERPSGEVTDWFIQRGGGLPMDFATAYCVFMRELGIPARVTMGYAMGDLNPDGSNSRLVRVLHMMFWVEVYIPFSATDGQWIQVIPLPLPGDFAGGDLPQNLGSGNVTILVGTPQNIALQLLGYPTIPQWSMIGDSFNLSAMVLVNGQPFAGSESIRFYDLTDGKDMGTSTIVWTDRSHLPLANVTYAFPDGSTPGGHNISAMWITSSFLATGFTTYVAVGQSNPQQANLMVPEASFIPSDIIDIDIKLGLSTYNALWNDTLRIHGTMNIGGSPANGTRLAELGNDQMWIMWDGAWIGNATVGPTGQYQFDLYVDATDTLRMATGQHTINAYYAGAYDPDTGIPVVLPGTSVTSTVTISAAVGFSFSVSPTNTSGGGTISYDGILSLLNGTLLASTTVGILFDGTLVGTTVTNGTGGFNYGYVIPVSQPSGTYDAAVNYTSTLPDVASGLSSTVQVTVQSGSTTLTIDSTPRDPQPVFVYNNLTIFGSLTATSDGSPLVNRKIDVYLSWNNGTIWHSTTNTTIGGYYEFNYTMPAYSEGVVTYWTEFNSVEPIYQSSSSAVLSITLKRFDVIVYIETIQSSVVVGNTLDIQGFLYLPEYPGLLAGEPVSLWWDNGTVYNIANVVTNIATGLYIFNYTVPLDHNLQTISLWANYSSTSPQLYSNESQHLSIVVRNYNSYISVFSNTTVVHVNESVRIYGSLQHENGTFLAGMPVTIHWYNGTDNSFTMYTDSSGLYSFIYNCTPSKDSVGTVSVWVNHTSSDPTYSSSSAMLSPSLTLQLYQLTLDANVASNTVHLDENIVFSGTLTLDKTGSPVAGATIAVYYQNSTGVYVFTKITNLAGGFVWQYNCSLNDALGAVYVWAQYTSTDPLWDNAVSLTRTVNLILYSMTLTTYTNSSAYYIDDVVHIWGQLTYTDNSTPLANQQVYLYWNNTASEYWWPLVTNSSGIYELFYKLAPGVDPEGSVTTWATFTTSVPLWENANSWPGVTFSVARYAFTVDLTVLPNPVYLNETITVQAHVYFTHNSSDAAGISLTFYWNNGTNWNLGTYQTNPSGVVQFTYAKMSEDTVWTGINIYAVYSGSPLIAGTVSNYETLTLQQWQTLINGFDTGGVTSYKLAETVVVAGILWYDLPTDVQFGGQVVEILVDGIPVNTTVTAGDGSFTGYWRIPTDTPTGTYSITVRFNSSRNWIASFTYAPATTISIDAINIIWTLNVSPNPVYRSEWLYINGTLNLDTGSAYAGGIVNIYWQSPSASSPVQIAVRTTDGSGFFELWYRVSNTAELGLTTIIANCSSGAPLIAASWSYAMVSVQQIPVVLTGSGDHSLIYLGNTIIFTGSLTFGNGTPMVGYDVLVIWDGATLHRITVTDVSGSFSDSYFLPWYEPVRNITYYLAFDKPSEAYQDAQTNGSDLEIRDRASIALNAQPTTVILRGDTLVISGTVTNGGGADQGVPLEILINGTRAGQYTTTDTAGMFSVGFLIRISIGYGFKNISVGFSSPNYDRQGSPAFWIIEVHIKSSTSVVFDSLSDVMPTQSFAITFSVADDDGNTPVGGSLSLYLNDTYITDIPITQSLNTTQTVVLSGSWSGGSGFFVARLVFSGTRFVEGSAGQTEHSIHIYDQVIIRSLGPGYAVVNNQVQLTGQLVDGAPAHYPIVGATVRLTLNYTGGSISVTTDSSGTFSYTLSTPFNRVGTYHFVAEFVMADGTLVSEGHTFQITSGGPPGLDAALLITWIVAIGMEAIVAMIIVARYRYGRGGSGFLGIRLRSRSVEVYDSLVR